jgi:hypothetical protein
MSFSALPSVSLFLYRIKMRCAISQTENGEEKKFYNIDTRSSFSAEKIKWLQSS